METDFPALFDFHLNGALYAPFPCCPKYATFVFQSGVHTALHPLEFRVVLFKVLVCPLPFLILFARDCI